MTGGLHSSDRCTCYQRADGDWYAGSRRQDRDWGLPWFPPPWAISYGLNGKGHRRLKHITLLLSACSDDSLWCFNRATGRLFVCAACACIYCTLYVEELICTSGGCGGCCVCACVCLNASLHVSLHLVISVRHLAEHILILQCQRLAVME